MDIICKFAQMEFRHGEAERGRTMFESIVTNYSKRTDLWSVFIDMVVKTGDISAARYYMFGYFMYSHTSLQ